MVSVSPENSMFIVNANVDAANTQVASMWRSPPPSASTGSGVVASD